METSTNTPAKFTFKNGKTATFTAVASFLYRQMEGGNGNIPAHLSEIFNGAVEAEKACIETEMTAYDFSGKMQLEVTDMKAEAALLDRLADVMDAAN